MSILVEPATLYFPLPHNRRIVNHLKVTNIGSEPVTWHFKVTDIYVVTCKPAKGILRPGESSSMTVSSNNREVALPKHKFRFEYRTITASEANEDVKNLWANSELPTLKKNINCLLEAPKPQDDLYAFDLPDDVVIICPEVVALTDPKLKDRVKPRAPCLDEGLFVRPPNKNFLCSICYLVMSDPVSLPSCGHTFGRHCIEGWLTSKDTCPICRKPSSLSMISSNVVLKNLIHELEVRCERRCEWQGLLEQAPAHKTVCPMAETQCANSPCSALVPRRDLDAHMAACDHRKVSCPHCNTSIAFKNMQAHLDICDRAPASCPNSAECGVFARADLAAHQAACPYLPSECPFVAHGCTFKCLRAQMDNHLSTATSQHLLLISQSYIKLQKRVEELEQRAGADGSARASGPRSAASSWNFSS